MIFLIYILIGGRAVYARGFDKKTGDIDLLVRLSDKDKWLNLMATLNYKSTQNNSIFTRFFPNNHINWPIDFMYVSDDVFSGFLAQATHLDLYDYKPLVASTKHIIFLKLHALKNYIEDRHSKDFLDVLELIRRNPNDITDSELQKACLKYANQDLYDKIKNNLSKK